MISFIGLDSGHMGSGVAIIMNISLARHVCKVSEVSVVKVSTWENSRGVKKTIDYVLVSSNLVNAVLECSIVDTSCKKNVVSFVSLMRYWDSLDSIKVSIIQDLVNSGVNSNHVHSALSGIRKLYYMSKLAEFLAAKGANIRAAVNKRMESFKMNKGHTIRSVLECSFCKVVLNHLVVNNKLILKPNSVKSKLDIIIEGWTRKHNVVADVSNVWSCQYWPLDYVFNEAFSGVMHSVEFSELLEVISDLPDGKAAGLSVLRSWKETWISIIPKPYEWKGVLMNICPIALIEMTCKILSKILSNKISLVYSTFDILHGDNFLVLKGITTQSFIFAIKSVLVLQNMWKIYNSVSWEHLKKSLVKIKMCGKFIWFFSSIHKNCTNKVMTDFGLTDVKRQESMCGYRLSSYFISRNSYAESQAGLSSFFAASAFTAIQHILDIASEFFQINDISINNNKTVTISINCRVNISSLFISGSPISIAKKSESHQYLGIFLSTEDFSKPSLVKTNSDVRFFTNLVLKKAVSDKQFLYLVLAVFHPIVSFKIQFSFVSIDMYNNLPLNFPNNTIYYPSFYGLKFFFQVQFESKVVFLVSFVNFGGVLDCLFFYRSYNLQVLCWHSVYPLSSPVHICVSASNNFLVGMVHVLLDCNLSLSGSLANFFRFCGGISMFTVLDKSQLDSHGLVPEWFKLFVVFLNGRGLSLTYPSVLNGVVSLNIFESYDFVSVCDHLSQVGANSLLVYTDEFLSNLGTVDCRAGIAAFFENINLGLDIGVLDLMSSTLAKLQAIALALENVSLLSSVKLFSDSQFALDCWIEHHHIVNVIYSHFGVLGNKHTDVIVDDVSLSGWYLLSHLGECFIVVDGSVVSGNFRHFVHDVGSGSKFLAGGLFSEVDWLCLSLVWHPNLYITAGFTSRPSANACTYFMKALHHWLLVVIQKYLYNRFYSSVLCLYCGDIEVSDHVFSCKINNSKAVSGFFHSSLGILQLLSLCVSDSSLSMAFYNGFVFNGWFCEVVTIFHNPKIAGLEIVKFVHFFSFAFKNNVWLVYAKHHAYMEKNVLIFFDGSDLVSVSVLASGLLVEVVKLLGIANVFGVYFGFCKIYMFFSDINDLVSVHIAV
ncbi:hypothetical protein G9A89_022680 [Geosiphon pyriformis]|nr:hypothetical protein G9A89_022680 [Geosiphon pyriformis]